MFEVASSKNPLSETNQNWYSAEPYKSLPNEYNNTFVRTKITCKKNMHKIWKNGSQKTKPTRIGKTENRVYWKPIGFGFGLGFPQGSIKRVPLFYFKKKHPIPSSLNKNDINSFNESPKYLFATFSGFRRFWAFVTPKAVKIDIFTLFSQTFLSPWFLKGYPSPLTEKYGTPGPFLSDVLSTWPTNNPPTHPLFWPMDASC
jgi:hypothetical protein